MTRGHWPPRKQKQRESLAASMMPNRFESSSIAMMNPSCSYATGESSTTYEIASQRSDELCWSRSRAQSSSLRPASNLMKESARLDDKQLHELGAAAASGVNWSELDMELAVANYGDRRGSIWKRKKLPRGYTKTNAMKIFTRLTVRDHRHHTRWGPKGFAVLAEGTLPCTVQELRLLFHAASTDAYRDVMRCIYRREFVDGEVLRTINIQREAGDPMRAFESSELSVKTAMFGRSNIFSKNKSWCFLELLNPGDRARVEQLTRRAASSSKSMVHATHLPAFTRTLASIARSSIAFDNELLTPLWSQQHVPNVVINYLFEQGPSSRSTRVVFHGEYLPPDAHDAFKRASHERRVARSWMLRLAASCHRFLLVVRRRRLGMQVIINSTRLPLEVVAKARYCACCRRSSSTRFKRLRRRLCSLCGFLVCEKCVHAREREHRARGDGRPQIEQVRICERCLIRVDQACYTAVTEEDVRPARVVSDPQSPGSRVYSASGGSLCGVVSRRTKPSLGTRPASLNDLLLETLADATAGGPDQRRRKANVLNVVKDIVEGERARIHASSVRTFCSSAIATRYGLPLLGERSDEFVDDESIDDVQQLKQMWDETPRWEDDYPLANTDSRNYQIEFLDDMTKAILPTLADDYKRQQLIRKHQLNKLGEVPELGIICSLASKELGCELITVTIVDQTQLYVLASNHPTVPSGFSCLREHGFCAHTILGINPLVSRHVQADVRFSTMPVVRKMGLNFYCGFPLVWSDGKTVVGSMCCADTKARDLTRSQYAAISSLATTASRTVQRAAEQRAVGKKFIDN